MHSKNSIARVKFPSHRHPPVVEVVAGVQFEDIKDFKIPHVGTLWKALGGEKKFRHIEEKSLLAKIGSLPQIHVLEEFVLPRIWFMSKNRGTLVQFQQDRFLFNWRIPDLTKRTPYPRYSSVISNFYDNYDKFLRCLKSLKFTPPSIQILELTYVNFTLVSEFGGIEHIDRLFKDAVWYKDKKRILPAPKTFGSDWRFETDHHASLHITANTVSRPNDGEPAINYQIAVRGQSPGNTIEDTHEWFDKSHEWIVKTFDDITSPYMHKKWGKE